MALSCAISMNVGQYAAGQNPPPQATLVVYNPNASAVVVSGVQLKMSVLGGTPINTLAASPVVVPMGPGMTVSVPALGSINIGPFPIVVASAASSNQSQAVNQTGNIFPLNPQGSQPLQYTLVVGADVYGSDGSANVATPMGFLVSYGILPNLASQGGFLNYGQPGTNFLNGLVLGLV